MSKTWTTALALTVMALGSCQPTPSDTLLGATDPAAPAASTSRATPTTAALDAEPAGTTMSTASLAPSTTNATTTTLPPTTSTTTTVLPTTTTTLPPSTTTTVIPRSTTSTGGTTQTTSTTAAAPEDQTNENSLSTHRVSVTAVEFMPGLWADVHAPDLPGDYPVIALVFGGGWAVGDRTQLSALAHRLASAGMVVINGEHRTLLGGRRLPAMLEEVSCLAAAAPHLAAPNLTVPAKPVWLLGYSSGAHLAAVAALSPSPSTGPCPYDASQIMGVIGLAGPYDLDLLWNEGVLTNLLASEVLREHFPELATFLQEQNRAAMQLFLRLLTGATPATPELWNPLNPIHLAPNHPERTFLLITGGEDQVIPLSHSTSFAEALTAGGHQVLTHAITEADHVALTDPDVVADLIVSFLIQETLREEGR